MEDFDIEKFVAVKARDIVDCEKQNHEIVQKPNESAIFDTTTDGLSFSDKAKEFVGAVATQKAVSDEELVSGITDKKKRELINNADANLKKEEAENKKAEILLQEANYGVYSGVANYAGIKKPLPKKMQAILFTILSVIQTVFLIIIGIPVSVINIVADCVDSIIKKLGTITKSARWVVLATLIGGAVFLIITIIRFYLRKFGIVN